MGEKHQLRKERLVNIRHHKKDGDDKTRSAKHEGKNPTNAKSQTINPAFSFQKKE